MVIGFYETKRQSLHYTSQLLKYLLRRQGIEYLSSTRDDISKADEIWVSVCDVTEVKMLRQARKLFPKHKIVVGGHAAHYPCMSVYADVVVRREAYRYIASGFKEEYLDDAYGAT